MKKIFGKKLTVFLTVVAILSIAAVPSPEGKKERPVQLSRNGRPAEVTVQDLSGLMSRPLRLLVERNNRVHGDRFIQVRAIGAAEGDTITADLTAPVPGVRATVYRIFREVEGPRYLEMPLSVYLPETGSSVVFEERVHSRGDEYLIFVFEQTNSPNEKEIQVRYFEERVRKLAITSFKTNWMFSSLKLKMKDLSEGELGHFFERDAQLLVERMIRPQQIVILRIWKINK